MFLSASLMVFAEADLQRRMPTPQFVVFEECMQPVIVTVRVATARIRTAYSYIRRIRMLARSRR